MRNRILIASLKTPTRQKVIIGGLLLALSIPCSLAAQDLDWSVSVGGSYNDDAYSGCLTSDGGYAILGATFSYGAGGYDVYLLKLDSLGDTLWSKTFGGSEADYGYDIQETVDGGLILVGATQSQGAGGKDVYLAKTDSVGTMLWTRTFGGASDDDGRSVRQTDDGGYVVAGTTQSYGPGLTDLYLIKTNANGDTLWTRAYGSVSGETGSAVRITPDGGYIAVGTTGGFGSGYSSLYAVRTDADGDSVWADAFGGDKADMGYSVAIVPDSGFVFVGATASFGAGYSDMYIVKTTHDGTFQWDRSFGGSGEERGYSIQACPDSGYIVAGFTQSFGAGQHDMFVVRTDPLGFGLWDRTFGGSESDYCRSIITGQNSWGLVGYSYSYSSGGSDFYVVKITGDQQTSVRDEFTPGLPESFALAQNYPNPFNPTTSIEFSLTQRANVTLTIYNVLGQMVELWQPGELPAGTHALEWNAGALASGVYLYRLQVGKQSLTRKMVLLR